MKRTIRILALISVTASLGGCLHRDYCADKHPIAYRQASPAWEANYRTCRMMEAVINQPAQRIAVDVFIRQ